MAASSVDQFIYTQGITDPGFYHKPSIINQVIGGNDMRFYTSICKICRKASFVGSLVGHDEREVSKVRK